MLICFIFVLCFGHLFGQSFRCPSNGLFSDPIRCTHYYECENMMPVSKQCGSELFFNPIQKICDWPASVDQSVCSGGKNSGNGQSTGNWIENSPNGQRPVVSTTSSPTSSHIRPSTIAENADHITFSCYADGLYEDPVSCEHFVECSNGTPFRKICPANLHFDIRIKACNWPESMSCNRHHEKPYTTARPRPSRPYVTPDVTPDYTGVYPTPPKYDDNTHTEKPGRVVTKPPINKPVTPKPPPNINDQAKCDFCFKCPNRQDQYYVNQYDRYTYYHCWLGEAYLMYCPRDRIWNQNRNTCVPEKPVGTNENNRPNNNSNNRPNDDRPEGNISNDKPNEPSRNNNDSNNESTVRPQDRPTNKPDPFRDHNDDNDDNSEYDGAGMIDARMKQKKDHKLTASKPLTARSKPQTTTLKPKSQVTGKSIEKLDQKSTIKPVSTVNPKANSPKNASTTMKPKRL